MIRLNICLTAKSPENAEQVKVLLTEAARLSRREPGCVRFEAYQSQNDPVRFFLNEWWESQQALDVHRTAQAYTTLYQPQVLPLVDRDPHPSTLLE